MTRFKRHSMLNGLPDSVEVPTRQPNTSSNGKQGVRRSKSTACLLAMNGSDKTPDDVEERQAEQAEQHINGRSRGNAKDVVRTRPVNHFVLHEVDLSVAQCSICCNLLASHKPH